MRTGSAVFSVIAAVTQQPRGNNPIMKRSLSDVEDDIPPLRYLGDAKLMEPQPPLAVADIQSDEFKAQLKMLQAAMKKYGGIGIAAPQVGWWTRVFCFGVDGSNPRYADATPVPFSIWLNPSIDTSACTEMNWMWEGCLSVPGLRGWVERPSECILRGLDETGKEQQLHLDGLAARIAQHEYDHLDGVLFPERTPGVHFMVPQASYDAKETWSKDWPSEGSRRTGPGQLSTVR